MFVISDFILDRILDLYYWIKEKLRRPTTYHALYISQEAINAEVDINHLCTEYAFALINFLSRFWDNDFYLEPLTRVSYPEKLTDAIDRLYEMSDEVKKYHYFKSSTIIQGDLLLLKDAYALGDIKRVTSLVSRISKTTLDMLSTWLDEYMGGHLAYMGLEEDTGCWEDQVLDMFQDFLKLLKTKPKIKVPS